MGKLDGRVVLISGGARGQGEAEARLFVFEGARVVLADVLDAVGEKLAEALGQAARYEHLDVTKPAEWARVVGGIRLASVSTIGLVTVSGILGDRFGGLGFFIFEGYNHSFPTEVLFGALPTVAIAIAVDLVLVALQRRLTPWANAAVPINPGRPTLVEVGAP